MKGLKIKCITSNWAKQILWEEEVFQATPTNDCMHVINVFSELLEQEIEGFGGAFTEAAAHTYHTLPENVKKELIQSYFGENGLQYNLCRLPIHSCDFGLGNYTYIEENDKELATFNICHDEKEIIPMVKDAQACAKEEIVFLSSPWSPPAFMKDTKEMNNGGKLLLEYYQVWANYYVRFIEAYEKRGIRIAYLTVQNEPLATQTWDSCIYEAHEEGAFVKEYLAPTLIAAGMDEVEIFIWDHNKEEMYQRVKETFEVEGCGDFVSGIAMHWYTGDHFDAIKAVRRAFPDKKVFFTEGCVEYSRFEGASDVQNAEMYAHDMLGDLKAGCSAFIDWNMLLDVKGGPNHVGNYCAAPIMEDGHGGIEKRLTYYYIGHFSRFIQQGAKQCMTSVYTDKIETLACVNPDGSKVIVVLNKSDVDMPITLREDNYGIETIIEKHSICTYVIS